MVNLPHVLVGLERVTHIQKDDTKDTEVLGADRRRRRRRFHSSYLARWESSDKVTPRNW
jgi:hypothetical protein